MRALALVLSCLLLATAVAGARPPNPGPRVATAAPEPEPIDPYADAAELDDGHDVERHDLGDGDDDGDDDDRDLELDERDLDDDRDRGGGVPAARRPAAVAPPAPARRPVSVAPSASARPRRFGGQSIGAPWSGRLQDATRLQLGDGTHIRRPHRAFGTKTTVEHIRRAVSATLTSHPKAHVLAIGDLSAPHGGWISEHNSHRSGRDVDLGLFFKRRPSGYPASFVRATDDTLDHAATWALLVNLLKSRDDDGGVQVIFLDYGVQGMLYRWAQANGVAKRRLDEIFQYPNGRHSDGLVRHEPNHADHLHVRYRCAKADTACY